MEYSNDPRPASPPAQLDHHPTAALFPLLEVESPEFGELVRDIREQGLQQPIVLHEGRILDGRNRYRACQHAGVEPRFVEWAGESPTAYVLSLNLHRRHLTDDQRAAVVQKARASLDAEAKERQRAAGREFGRGAGKLVADSPQAIDDEPTVEAGPDSPRARRAPTTRQRLAELGDVSEHKMRQTERVHKADPALLDQVHAGTVPLRGAVKEVERREGRPGKRAMPRTATVPEPAADEPEPPRQPQVTAGPAAVRAATIEPPSGPGDNDEPANGASRPSFEAIENADQDAQRKQFARLCSSLTALPLPTQFVERHDGNLTPDHIEPARAAHQWLTVFLTNLEPESQPRAAVTWTLDGFLHRLVQANGLMERHGAEIAELLANRISPGPDIAIVRATLALLGELDRRFGVLECGAGREQ